MRAKVIRAFKDARDAEKLYREGEPFEGSPERVAELAANGFLEPEAMPVKEKEPEAKEAAKAAPRRTRAKAKAKTESEEG